MYILFPCTCITFHCFLYHRNISASAYFYIDLRIDLEKVFHWKHFDLAKQNHIITPYIAVHK